MDRQMGAGKKVTCFSSSGLSSGVGIHVSLFVLQEEVQEYMVKMRAIDARPIKKLAEARARKKKKVSLLFGILLHVCV